MAVSAIVQKVLGLQRLQTIGYSPPFARAQQAGRAVCVRRAGLARSDPEHAVGVAVPVDVLGLQGVRLNHGDVQDDDGRLF